MKIKQLCHNSLRMNIYIYQNVDKEVMMIAIPDIYWSVELPIEMSKDEIHEELLMQFFNFYTENEADALARDICELIATN
ncbi:YueH family protein [Staphylococcus caprae]|uniref:YueH family protein n=1 Tax=Staphylococcus caprae TaxID=29380 RepID=UPI003B212713